MFEPKKSFLFLPTRNGKKPVQLNNENSRNPLEPFRDSVSKVLRLVFTEALDNTMSRMLLGSTTGAVMFAMMKGTPILTAGRIEICGLLAAILVGHLRLGIGLIEKPAQE